MCISLPGRAGKAVELRGAIPLEVAHEQVGWAAARLVAFGRGAEAGGLLLGLACFDQEKGKRAKQFEKKSGAAMKRSAAQNTACSAKRRSKSHPQVALPV